MPATKKYTAKERAAFGRKMAKARAAPRTRAVRGRGFYKGFGRDLGTGLGAAAGGFFGGPAGALAGANFGRSVGGGIAQLTGRGAYSGPGLSRNTLVLPVNPRIINDLTREGAVVIRHREHIGTIVSSTSFEVQYELPLNPAQNGSFPWLSSIAANFTQYEMLGCIYEYVSTSGNAVSSTNNALGEVIMTSNANSLDSSYQSKTAMLNSDFAQAFAPSVNGALPIECSPAQSTLTKLYTRYGAVKPGADVRMADLGVVTIATSGMQAADIEIGELYVNYEVALLKPQLVSELGYLQPQSYHILNGSTNSAPLGTTRTSLINTLGVTFASNVITIPRNTSGKFELIFSFQGTTAALVKPTHTYVNMKQIDACRNGTTGTIQNDGSSADTFIIRITVQILDSSKESTVTIGTGATLPSSLSTSDLTISQLNWDITE